MTVTAGTPTTAERPPRHQRAQPVPTRPRWRSLNVHPVLYAILGLALFLGPIGVTQLTGDWQTSGRGGGGGRVTTLSGADPAEIKGWMTIQMVVEGYRVTPQELYAQFKIPASVPVTTELRGIEPQAPGFSVDALRTWLAQRAKSGAPR